MASSDEASHCPVSPRPLDPSDQYRSSSTDWARAVVGPTRRGRIRDGGLMVRSGPSLSYRRSDAVPGDSHPHREFEAASAGDRHRAEPVLRVVHELEAVDVLDGVHRGVVGTTVAPWRRCGDTNARAGSATSQMSTSLKSTGPATSRSVSRRSPSRISMNLLNSAFSKLPAQVRPSSAHNPSR